MTGLYDWNPMPHKISIMCPQCAAEAKFEFAETVHIRLKQDVPFFQKSDVFEYGFFEGFSGNRWHGATYYHGLRSSSTSEIRDLPGGYEPQDWCHNQCLYRSHGSDVGTIVCQTCFLRRKHELDWPSEAFFQIQYKQKLLWAFDRETTISLIDFVKAQDRKTKRAEGKWQSFLRHVPKHFLLSGARHTVLKKLNNLLSVD